MFKYKKDSTASKEPLTRANPGDAGFDLRSSENVTIPANTRRLIGTGLYFAIPEGYYGRIASRSGLAYKNKLDTCAGVVDQGYSGEVKVLIHNHSDVDFSVEKDMRIAQFIIEKIYTDEAIEVDNLDETVRGEGGFGSTGL